MNWQEGAFGSGWVWSLIGLILVIISLFGIRKQLRSANAANAVQRIETLQGTWDSPQMIYARLVTALHLKSGRVDLAGFFKAQGIVRFFMNLDDLESAGYLSIKEIYIVWGPAILNWMAMLGPTVEVVRIDRGPGSFATEPLVAKLRRHEQKQGLRPVVPEGGTFEKTLRYGIALTTAILQQEADRQSGQIPGMPSSRGAGATRRTRPHSRSERLA